MSGPGRRHRAARLRKGGLRRGGLRKVLLLLPLPVLPLALTACASAPSTLDARGPGSASIALLWWVMLVLGSTVFVIVTGYILYAGLRPAPERGPRAFVGADDRFIAVCGIAIPAVVLLVVLGLTVWTGADTYRPPSEPALTIEVVAHQFWWEVRYPDAETTVVTANEIHMPAGQPVRFVLEADDVIHSFWVPQLHGKMDHIPGHTNEFWLEADEPGQYRGVCAEFCGIQHAQMHFLLVASAQEEFDDWLAGQAEEADDTEDVAAGREVFIDANCVACHAVRGLSGASEIGPDLTHFASRRTLAAGMQVNDRENLREWILDPNQSKPGVRMPATTLADEDLEALLDYLESLE